MTKAADDVTFVYAKHLYLLLEVDKSNRVIGGG